MPKTQKPMVETYQPTWSWPRFFLNFFAITFLFRNRLIKRLIELFKEKGLLQSVFRVFTPISFFSGLLERLRVTFSSRQIEKHVSRYLQESWNECVADTQTLLLEENFDQKMWQVEMDSPWLWILDTEAVQERMVTYKSAFFSYVRYMADRCMKREHEAVGVRQHVVVNVQQPSLARSEYYDEELHVSEEVIDAVIGESITHNEILDTDGVVLIPVAEGVNWNISKAELKRALRDTLIKRKNVIANRVTSEVIRRFLEAQYLPDPRVLERFPAFLRNCKERYPYVPEQVFQIILNRYERFFKYIISLVERSKLGHAELINLVQYLINQDKTGDQVIKGPQCVLIKLDQRYFTWYMTIEELVQAALVACEMDLYVHVREEAQIAMKRTLDLMVHHPSTSSHAAFLNRFRMNVSNKHPNIVLRCDSLVKRYTKVFFDVIVQIGREAQIQKSFKQSIDTAITEVIESMQKRGVITFLQNGVRIGLPGIDPILWPCDQMGMTCLVRHRLVRDLNKHIYSELDFFVRFERIEEIEAEHENEALERVIDRYLCRGRDLEYDPKCDYDSEKFRVSDMIQINWVDRRAHVTFSYLERQIKTLEQLNHILLKLVQYYKKHKNWRAELERLLREDNGFHGKIRIKLKKKHHILEIEVAFELLLEVIADEFEATSEARREYLLSYGDPAGPPSLEESIDRTVFSLASPRTLLYTSGMTAAAGGIRSPVAASRDDKKVARIELV